MERGLGRRLTGVFHPDQLTIVTPWQFGDLSGQRDHGGGRLCRRRLPGSTPGPVPRYSGALGGGKGGMAVGASPVNGSIRAGSSRPSRPPVHPPDNAPLQAVAEGAVSDCGKYPGWGIDPSTPKHTKPSSLTRSSRGLPPTPRGPLAGHVHARCPSAARTPGVRKPSIGRRRRA